jgi:hypothetical protein
MKNLKSKVRNIQPSIYGPDGNEKQNSVRNVSFAKFKERPTEVP